MTFGTFYSSRFVRDPEFDLGGCNFDFVKFAGTFVTFGACFSPRFDFFQFQGNEADFYLCGRIKSLVCGSRSRVPFAE